MGLICLTGGFCRLLPCLGIGPVSGPCDLSPKLLWGRAYKRGGTMPLLTEAELVETLMYLHLSTVVSPSKLCEGGNKRILRPLVL